MTRRGFLRGLLAATLAGLFLAAYGFFVEPALRMTVRRWRISPPGWRRGHQLRIAVLADLHMGEPHVGLGRLRRIVARVNAMEPDLVLILGDLVAGHRFVTAQVPVAETAKVLAGLKGRLGVFAVLGNHDWWDDLTAQKRGHGPVLAQMSLEDHGIPVLENRALRLDTAGGDVWLAGLGDQLALVRGGGRFDGVDDLPGTLAQIPDDGAPVILMAHEPDIFPEVPERVALTLSGHTHGGQVRLFGWSPVVPSRYGNRYAYGHVREGARDLVVSGGIGCSILPVRFGVVPEITVIELS
ncbi:metallophosphoesterase [Pseudooceanicola atlanticus]|uniref:Metallophosphoesterase n=1 Tax=Pseudooceanicola atlanticus TaxID=1461694 RepID=A0A0A0EET2_9RHOB|nr:metallophosphoesterase [Pseudooceanicola atlanticus]KGM48879.1 metallophosphoesterase [Pseudooceanicola atlanticus]